MKTVNSTLSVFSGRDLQTFKHIVLALKRDRISLAKAIAFIDSSNNLIYQRKLVSRIKPINNPCPECGQGMALYPVNTTPEDQVGEGFQSMWLCGTSCSGKGCGHEIYSTSSVQDEIIKLTTNGG